MKIFFCERIFVIRHKQGPCVIPASVQVGNSSQVWIYVRPALFPISPESPFQSQNPNSSGLCHGAKAEEEQGRGADELAKM